MVVAKNIEEIRARKEKVPELSEMGQVAAMLNLIYSRMVADEGRSPNFYVQEFDLATTIRITLNADFNPDRWMIYFRTDSTVTLRVFPGDYVPPQGAIEIASGQMGIISNRGERISIHNSGTGTAHVFAVAIGGGAEFDLMAV